MAQTYPAQQPYAPPQSYPAQSYPPQSAQAGAPLSLGPQEPSPADDDDLDTIPGGPPHPYYGEPERAGLCAAGGSATFEAVRCSRHKLSAAARPEFEPAVAAAAEPVQVQPPATLACPIISVLDRWISDSGAAGGDRNGFASRWSRSSKSPPIPAAA